MLLTIGFVIAVVSTYSEVKLVHGSAWIRKTYTQGRWGIDGVYWNTAGSFILSYVIGLMFSAEGLTVLFGGVLSTGMSQMYFSTEGFCHEQGWSWKKFGDGMKGVLASGRGIRDRGKAIYADFRQPVLDLITMTKWTFRIITFPFAVIRSMSRAYTERKAA